MTRDDICMARGTKRKLAGDSSRLHPSFHEMDRWTTIHRSSTHRHDVADMKQGRIARHGENPKPDTMPIFILDKMSLPKPASNEQIKRERQWEGFAPIRMLFNHLPSVGYTHTVRDVYMYLGSGWQEQVSHQTFAGILPRKTASHEFNEFHYFHYSL